jgi:hypothetical protein
VLLGASVPSMARQKRVRVGRREGRRSAERRGRTSDAGDGDTQSRESSGTQVAHLTGSGDADKSRAREADAGEVAIANAWSVNIEKAGREAIVVEGSGGGGRRGRGDVGPQGGLGEGARDAPAADRGAHEKDNVGGEVPEGGGIRDGVESGEARVGRGAGKRKG